jgi:hypothetical protein
VLLAASLPAAAVRPQLIDEYLPKVEEWVERSKGKVRADVATRSCSRWATPVGAHHPPCGREGEEVLPGRARAGAPALGDRAGDVAAVRLRRRAVVDGVKTVLFVAWLAWSRFRVVLPIRDKTMPSVFAALDVTFRRLGGVPTYVLTDNEKTVTVEHIAGIPVRNRSWWRSPSTTRWSCTPASRRIRRPRAAPSRR